MEEHANVAAMRHLYDAFTAKDVGEIAQSLAETTYHIPGDNIIAGTYRGGEEILALMARQMTETNGTWSLRVHDIVGDEKHVVALDRITGRRGDREIDLNRVVIAHVVDGRAMDIWVVPQDQYAFDEFWG
jgi:ketosteroid isomerase-like protein